MTLLRVIVHACRLLTPKHWQENGSIALPNEYTCITVYARIEILNISNDMYLGGMNAFFTGNTSMCSLANGTPVPYLTVLKSTVVESALESEDDQRILIHLYSLQYPDENHVLDTEKSGSTIVLYEMKALSPIQKTYNLDIDMTRGEWRSLQDLSKLGADSDLISLIAGTFSIDESVRENRCPGDGVVSSRWWRANLLTTCASIIMSIFSIAFVSLQLIKLKQDRIFDSENDVKGKNEKNNGWKRDKEGRLQREKPAAVDMQAYMKKKHHQMTLKQ